MAGGWAMDGAVQDQIEDTINDELARMRAAKRPTGDSIEHGADCGEAIIE